MEQGFTVEQHWNNLVGMLTLSVGLEDFILERLQNSGPLLHQKNAVLVSLLTAHQDMHQFPVAQQHVRHPYTAIYIQ